MLEVEGRKTNEKWEINANGVILNDKKERPPILIL